MKSRVFVGAAAALSVVIAVSAGCGKDTQDASPGKKPVPITTIPGHDTLDQDTAPKESQRLVPPEAYLRTYLQIFGGATPLTPLEAQTEAKTKVDGKEMALFDTWADYLALLGLPDYAVDIPRTTQSNSLMMATFERMGVALCDRAVERDLKADPPAPVSDRRVFAFEAPADIDEKGFGERFDVLHRTFLGYPAALATTARTAKYWKLYNDTITAHSAMGAPSSRFSPSEAGWAAVCYGLVRHPEFHLY